jgi:origin recognition complex subunit 5
MAEHLDVLLTASYPTFIYINDRTSIRLTYTSIASIIYKYPFARVNAVACFTPRLLYDSILNSYGCDGKWNENLDAFLHGLRAVAKGRKLVLLLEKPERLLPDLIVPFSRLAELVRNFCSSAERSCF